MAKNTTLRKHIKQNKPFTPNIEKRDAQLHNALRNVQDAVDALALAQESATMWGDYETIQHFKHHLSEWLSSDNDEAGYEPYLRKQAGKK